MFPETRKENIMTKKVVLPALLCALAAAPLPAAADSERADSAEVVAKVEEAAALIREEGEAALAKIADPASGFVWKDTYVFVVNCEADRVMVNPAFPERVGGDIKQHTDYAGYRYGQALCDMAERPGGGWIEYVWLPPGGDTPKRKVSYVRSVAGTPYQLGAGVYDHATSVAHSYKELRSDH